MARFHTSLGQFVGWKKLPNGLLSLSQAIVRKSFGKIPRQPWIPFSAKHAIQNILTSDFTVWEIGSGFSTLWLAERVKKVISIESSKEWHDRLSHIISSESITNIDLRFEWQAQRMADFSELQDETLDLLYIDGGPRGLCLENGFMKVRPGGYI